MISTCAEMILIYADSIFIREEMLFVGIAMILSCADVIFIRAEMIFVCAEMILTRVNENWSGEDWIKSRVSEI